LYDTINRSWLSRLLVIGFWEYLARVAPRGTHDWQLFLTPAELHRLLTDHGLQPGAIQGMLPVWWSPWHGWRFRLIRYTGILYLGYALKPAEAPQGGGGEPRPVATAGTGMDPYSLAMRRDAQARHHRKVARIHTPSEAGDPAGRLS